MGREYGERKERLGKREGERKEERLGKGKRGRGRRRD